MPTLMMSHKFIDEHAARLDAIAKANATTFNLVRLATNIEYLPEDVASTIDIAYLSRDIRFGSVSHSGHYAPVPEACPHFFDPVEKSKGFKWLQIPSAGIDRPIYSELLERGIRISTGAGTHAEPIAQTAIGAILMLSRGFMSWQPAQRAHQWDALRDERAPKDLRGQTLVIVGVGSIGGYTAPIAKALGLKVIGVRRSPKRADDAVDEIVPPSELDRLLPTCDWLMLCCPLTDETRGLMNARRFALMKKGTHLLNVARGPVVVEKDLIAALESGHLGGAYLDVFDVEPLAPESPLWDMPNVICTPHNSSASDGNDRRAGEIFLTNLDRYLKGTPLVNEVRL
ncbi:MAG: D-2-hydroxyacid dehydrogenase [Proteobacteria bacterium]|nr:D-2-hydroxyacid dehydrogenase [Burkholderiales bacterium]